MSIPKYLLITISFLCFSLFITHIQAADRREPAPIKSAAPVTDATKQAISLTPKERAWLSRHPVIKIGIGESWAPFVYKKSDGTLEGYDVDLLALINELTGAHIQLVTGQWKDIVDQAERREIDGLAESAVIKSRAEYFLFTDPYNVVEYAAATLPEKAAAVRSGSDLRGKRIAYLKGNAWTGKIIDSIGKVRKIEARSEEEAFLFVVEGKADFALVPLHQYTPLREIYHQSLTIAYVFTNEELILKTVYSIRKDWPELVSIINKALAAIDKSERQAILEKWVPAAKVSAEPALPRPVEFDEIPFLFKSLGSIFICITVTLIVVWLVRGRPRQLSIRDTLLFVSLVFAMLIVSSAIFVIILLKGQEQQRAVEVRKAKSLDLALELKQSSDDLTRFARTYVETGDPKYERYYWTIVAIRDGKRAHPKEFTRSYWDHVAAGVMELDQDGKVYSIEKRMIKIGLTEDEKKRLSEAKKESDDLINLEKVAMNAVKGLYKDDSGRFTKKGKPDFEMARMLMHGKEYHDAKSRIMKPIDQFFSLLEVRTANELNLVSQRNQATILGIMVLVAVTICFSIYVFFLLRRRIISPLGMLEAEVLSIREGDYSHRIDLATRDEMGALANVFNSMAGSIEEKTSRLYATIESTTDGILVIDLHRKITSYNTRFLEIWHLDRKLVESGNDDLLLDVCMTQLEEPEAFLERVKYFIDNPEKEDFTTLLLRDGRTLERYSKPQRLGDLIIGRVWSFRDITMRKRMEKALQKESERLQNILDASPIGVVFSSKGIIRFANPRFKEMFDVRVGDPSPDLYVDPKERDVLINKLTDEGRVENYELQMYGRNHEVRGILINYLSINYEGEDGILGWLLDITERKKADEELKKLSRAVEQSPASVVITDTRGNMEYVNPRFQAVTGYTPEEAIGKNPSILKSGKNPPELYQELWKTITAGKEWRGEFLNKKKNGELYWESASISPIMSADGSLTHFIAVKEDITDRKQMEIDLLNAKVAAEEATQAKSDFLANMSHEIRTPMNAVIGMAHLAMQTDLTPKQLDYLKKIDLSSKSLLRIINDILDFSKIEAGKLDMESVEFDVVQMLTNITSMIMVRAHEKGSLEVLFRLDLDMPHMLIGDPLRLSQILINLGNNAVKFTAKGEILLNCKVVEKQGENILLQFSIRDSGIGMTGEQAARLFQPFSQADTSTSRKYGGTGLGLAISKSLVEMMGGEIWVKSEVGRGSEFGFTVQLGIGEDKEKKPLTLDDDIKDLRILVIDDNATARQIFDEMLRSLSFKVDLASSGKMGLDLIREADRQNPYRLILMDWKMPGMDGIEASRRIKNSLSPDRVPKIILITAYAQDEAMAGVESAGLDGLLIKPVTPSSLLDAIMQAFGKEAFRESSSRKREREKTEGLSAIRGARILLVEDNEINQQVAREILEGAGLVVTLANNGKEGLDAVLKDSFDAVLMDVQMPVMDGYEATRQIRGLDPETADLPIIAMTAHAMSGDREKSLEAGLNDHITKPIDPDELLSVLVKWVGPRDREISDDLAKRAQPDPEADILPEELPGISIKTGISRVGGNRRLYWNLLGQFSEKNKNVTDEIKSSLKSDDRENAARLAHTIKGVSGNLGMEDLFLAAGALEKAIRQEEAGPVDALLDKFETDLNIALSGIETLKKKEAEREGKEAAVEKGPIDIETVKPLLAEMARLLEHDLSEAMERLEALKPHLENSKARNEFNRLIKQMEEFDTDGAMKVLEEILDSLNISTTEDE